MIGFTSQNHSNHRHHNLVSSSQPKIVIDHELKAAIETLRNRLPLADIVSELISGDESYKNVYVVVTTPDSYNIVYPTPQEAPIPHFAAPKAREETSLYETAIDTVLDRVDAEVQDLAKEVDLENYSLILSHRSLQSEERKDWYIHRILKQIESSEERARDARRAVSSGPSLPVDLRLGPAQGSGEDTRRLYTAVSTPRNSRSDSVAPPDPQSHAHTCLVCLKQLKSRKTLRQHQNKHLRGRVRSGSLLITRYQSISDCIKQNRNSTSGPFLSKNNEELHSDEAAERLLVSLSPASTTDIHCTANASSAG